MMRLKRFFNICTGNIHVSIENKVDLLIEPLLYFQKLSVLCFKTTNPFNICILGDINQNILAKILLKNQFKSV